MSEVANILRSATPASLLILDEIGRGTSTYDGMAIARAILEYCADKRRLGARTMFATHYHELSELEGELEGIRNYNITAKKQNGKLIFLRKIVPGAADDSYAADLSQISFADMQADEIRDILKKTDLNVLTPLEALNLLYTLQRKALS